MNDPTSSLFDSLSPEQLAALLQGSTLQDQGGLLEQQLADLLGGGMQHREHSTPIGAGLGGIAEALDGTANAFHAKALRGDQQKNLDAQGKLKGEFASLLRGPKDPAAEFSMPPFPQRAPSTPPMVGAGPTPQSPMHGGVMPELDISPPGNQPSDPTEIVNDGSSGWGLDLSAPGHAEALAASLRGQSGAPTPGMDISALPEVAGAQLPDIKKLLAQRGRPFSY